MSVWDEARKLAEKLKSQARSSAVYNKLDQDKSRAGLQVFKPTSNVARTIQSVKQDPGQLWIGRELKNQFAQARRQAAELMQGIQARYGGTTGTGRFTSEILGSQATRNIAQNQAALRQYKAQMDSELQNTMSKIGLAENELKTKVTSLINQEDQNLQQAKIQLRANLDKSLADISQQRSMLETEKANKRYEILNDYQNRLDQVERYNLDHKRQLEAQYQQQQNEINMLKQQAQQSYAVKTNELKTLTAPQLSQFVSGGILSPQQAFQQAQNTGYIDKDLKYQPTGEVNTDNLYDNQRPIGEGDLNSQVEDILNAGGGGAG